MEERGKSDADSSLTNRVLRIVTEMGAKAARKLTINVNLLPKVTLFVTCDLTVLPKVALLATSLH
jgi:hypothetical protein